MIERSPHRERFTRIDNRTLEDQRLSWQARGLLAYLLSRPDHWRIDRDQLASQAPNGEKAVRALLRELEACGYLTRQRRRDERGRMIWLHVVHEMPVTSGQKQASGPVGRNRPVAPTSEDAAKAQVGSSGRKQASGVTSSDAAKPQVGSSGRKQASVVTTEVTTEPTTENYAASPRSARLNGASHPPASPADDLDTLTAAPTTNPGQDQAGAQAEPEVVDAELVEPEPDPKPENAGTVTAAYIDWRRANGIADPDERTKGILSRQLREAFAAGYPADVIKRGLWDWHHSSQHPSTLFSFVDAVARGGGRSNGNGRLSEQERRLQASVRELLPDGGIA